MHFITAKTNQLALKVLFLQLFFINFFFIEIIERIKIHPDSEENLFRPLILDLSPVDDAPETVKKLIDLMINCWSENPFERPEFSMIRKIVHTLNK